MDDLPKAMEFYNKVEEEFENSKYWGMSVFPVRYRQNSEVREFKASFNELDEVEREQWFEHNYHEACNSALLEGEYVRAREVIILLLKACIILEVKLTRPYEFGKLIFACWIKPAVRIEEIREQLNDIFYSCGFDCAKRTKKPKAGCGCLKSECQIF